MYSSKVHWARSLPRQHEYKVISLALVPPRRSEGTAADRMLALGALAGGQAHQVPYPTFRHVVCDKSTRWP